jgi:hypothetical protein
MSSLDAESTLTDVAFIVCTALERAGEPAVLCGGSAATFYAPEKYESRDLDFVLHLRDAPVYDRSRRDHFLRELESAVTRRPA